MSKSIRVTKENCFDYDAIKPELRSAVKGHAEKIRVLFERTASNVIAIGKHLHAVRDRLPYGLFVRWIYAEIDLSPTSALRYIQIAKRFGDLPKAQLDKLQPMALGLLVNGKVPPGAVEETLRRAKAGERITWGKAHEIIHEHRPAEEKRGIKDRERRQISALMARITKDRTPEELAGVAQELGRHKTRIENAAGNGRAKWSGIGGPGSGELEPETCNLKPATTSEAAHEYRIDLTADLLAALPELAAKFAGLNGFLKEHDLPHLAIRAKVVEARLTFDRELTEADAARIRAIVESSFREQFPDADFRAEGIHPAEAETVA